MLNADLMLNMSQRKNNIYVFIGLDIGLDFYIGLFYLIKGNIYSDIKKKYKSLIQTLLQHIKI